MNYSMLSQRRRAELGVDVIRNLEALERARMAGPGQSEEVPVRFFVNGRAFDVTVEGALVEEMIAEATTRARVRQRALLMASLEET